MACDGVRHQDNQWFVHVQHTSLVPRCRQAWAYQAPDCVVTVVLRPQALGLRGAFVTLTDLPACMELLRYNASLNFAPAKLGGVFPAHALSCIGRPVALLHTPVQGTFTRMQQGP